LNKFGSNVDGGCGLLAGKSPDNNKKKSTMLSLLSSRRYASEPGAFPAKRLAGIGTEIVASIVGFGLVGWLLDRWIGIFPWLTTIGLILGVIGGLYNSVRKAYKILGYTSESNSDNRNIAKTNKGIDDRSEHDTN